MKNNLLIYVFVLLTSHISIAQDWVLSKNQDGIKVYTRAFKNSGFKEFKGETEMEGSIESFVSVFRDVPNFHLVFESAINPKLLKREGDTLQVHYLKTETPWPVSNRDGIYQYIFRYNALQKELTIDLIALPTFLPLEKDIIRVPKATGFWKVKTLANGKIHVMYQLHAEPGGAIPAWLANSGSIDLPFNTLSKLKKRIVLKEYQGKKYTFIK